MTLKHAPATPLPWYHKCPPTPDDFYYARHAANAYPKLVEALHACYARGPVSCTNAGTLLRELGEL